MNYTVNLDNVNFKNLFALSCVNNTWKKLVENYINKKKKFILNKKINYNKNKINRLLPFEYMLTGYNCFKKCQNLHLQYNYEQMKYLVDFNFRLILIRPDFVVNMCDVEYPNWLDIFINLNIIEYLAFLGDNMLNSDLSNVKCKQLIIYCPLGDCCRFNNNIDYIYIDCKYNNTADILNKFLYINFSIIKMVNTKFIKENVFFDWIINKQHISRKAKITYILDNKVYSQLVSELYRNDFLLIHKKFFSMRCKRQHFDIYNVKFQENKIHYIKNIVVEKPNINFYKIHFPNLENIVFKNFQLNNKIVDFLRNHNFQYNII
ncbi:hypothetical protein SGHV057 [Glossina pallidipes salivary gland hypertrophy virus]|uniref:Uncharacterized protein n=1 Tax=Glossina hytrovirus (isolate Glossina pallidipes/Ethiopia/Seibersdorf/-) TaxID=379529 RepID=B0YLL1_GHVS|nr:hypothetical protein SGHV057 [Glossina pallidipes salivary gland hypertrophy virus]ABQ08830.1 hypothetical protein SGHV057 [Glossina pallidipes salivary gland hypertrophy virus]